MNQRIGLIGPSTLPLCGTIHTSNLLSRVKAVLKAMIDVSSSNRLALLAGFLLFHSSFAFSQNYEWSTRPPSYAMGIQRGVNVAMSDGVVLLVDVYSPADSIMKASGEKFPVLITQNPYAFMNEAPFLAYVDFYVKRGYICVLAHVRGTNGSGGQNGFLSQREQIDGVELVEWASKKLANSNGTIGLFGTSWLGFTQLHTAARLPEGSPVKAMVPTYAGAYIYRELTPGGIPSQSIFFPRDFDQPTMLNNESASLFGKSMYESWTGKGEVSLQSPFWEAREPIHFIDGIHKSKIPTLLVGGWRDLYPTGMSELFAALQNSHSGKGPLEKMDARQNTTGNIQMVMGNWAHYKGLNVEMTLVWYDKWLKGIDVEDFNLGGLYHAQDLTTGEWYDFKTYPFSDEYKTLLLGRDLLPSAKNTTPVLKYGPRTAPSSSLDFRYSVVKDDLILAGPGAVRLSASTSSGDMHFLIEVFDQSPSGESVRLTQGNILASMSEVDEGKSWYSKKEPVRPFLTLDNRKKIVPGKVYVLEFPLSPVMATIKNGHQLVVRVSTQSSPEDCKGNLGVFPCFPTESQLNELSGGEFTLHLTKDAKCGITLPVVQKRSLTPSKKNYNSTPNHPF
jgi:predicted acyl esterase